jgi:predicted nuclease with TOPRIM domain
MTYPNDDHISVAALAAQYDIILTENLKLRQDRTDLRRENSAQAGRINSLEVMNAKLKEEIEKLGGNIE